MPRQRTIVAVLIAAIAALMGLGWLFLWFVFGDHEFRRDDLLARVEVPGKLIEAFPEIEPVEPATWRSTMQDGLAPEAFSTRYKSKLKPTDVLMRYEQTCLTDHFTVETFTEIELKCSGDRGEVNVAVEDGGVISVLLYEPLR